MEKEVRRWKGKESFIQVVEVKELPVQLLPPEGYGDRAEEATQFYVRVRGHGFNGPWAWTLKLEKR